MKLLYQAGIFIFVLTCMSFCASVPLIPLPRRSPIKPVVVTNNCLCGENLDYAVQNWIEANEYIEVLKKTGCFDKEK